jgi:hypothetical protein
MPRADTLHSTAKNLYQHFRWGGLQKALVLIGRQEIERLLAHHGTEHPLRLFFTLNLKCHDPRQHCRGIKLADHCVHIGEASRDRVQRREITGTSRGEGTEKYDVTAGYSAPMSASGT